VAAPRSQEFGYVTLGTADECRELAYSEDGPLRVFGPVAGGSSHYGVFRPGDVQDGDDAESVGSRASTASGASLAGSDDLTGFGDENAVPRVWGLSEEFTDSDGAGGTRAAGPADAGDVHGAAGRPVGDEGGDRGAPVLAAAPVPPPSPLPTSGPAPASPDHLDRGGSTRHRAPPPNAEHTRDATMRTCASFMRSP